MPRLVLGSCGCSLIIVFFWVWSFMLKPIEVSFSHITQSLYVNAGTILNFTVNKPLLNDLIFCAVFERESQKCKLMRLRPYTEKSRIRVTHI